MLQMIFNAAPQWHNDEKRAFEFLVLHEIRNERNSLYGLAEAHLVGENAVKVVVV